MDLVAAQDSAPRKVNWGPWEFIQTLSQASDHMDKLQENDFVLKATLKNQLLAFRFDDQGNIVLVDDDPVLKEANLSRQPPTRGLRPALCEERIDQVKALGPEGPPKPDWSKLDALGDFRQVAPPQEAGDPEDFLDIPLEQLDLSDQQKYMLRPIHERVQDLAIDQEAKAHVKRHSQWANKLRGKRRGRWSTLLANRLFSKYSQPWRKKMADTGRDVEKFTQAHAPVVKGAKAIRNLAKALSAKAKKHGFTKGTTKAHQMVERDLEDHPHKGQEVRVIARGHQLRGLVGHVIRVYVRSQANGQHPQEFACLSMKNNLQHLALSQIQLVAEEKALGLKDPAPAKLNYQRFQNAAKTRHKEILGITKNVDRLEFAKHEHPLELTTVHCGILEVLARFGDFAQGITWLAPAEAVSLALMDPTADDHGSNLDALASKRSALDSGTAFFAIQWADQHYVLVAAKRNATSEPWRIFYQDSLVQEHKACRKASTDLLRNLAIMAPNQTLPISEAGAQVDGWSCGLWALRNLETILREWHQEPAQAEATVEMVRARLNLHITKLRPGVPLPAVPKTLKPAPKTLEDALELGLKCTKCRPTRYGYKGCTECMGPWFSQVRTRGRGSNCEQPGGSPFGLPHAGRCAIVKQKEGSSALAPSPFQSSGGLNVL